jgi:hypothetical protein
MTAPWVPRRSYLRVFGISLVMVFLALIVFLFAVHLESTVPASAVFHGRDEQGVRAPVAGLVELGWYEGETHRSGQSVRVRVDAAGNGTTDPEHGGATIIENHKTADGQEIRVDRLRFHKLEAGDLLWPGQVFAQVSHDAQLKQRPEQAPLRAPGERYWLVLKVYASPRQAVEAGDAVAHITPADPKTREPLDPVAHLEIQEKHASEVRVGQRVRFYSTMFNQRLHGHADGVIERLEPAGEPGAHGERKFRGVASITTSPFPVRLGSSARVEIVIGPKRVYNIILEH